MKLKERIKNVGFWASLIGSVFLIIGAFGVEIGGDVMNEVINAVCSLLVVFGIVSDPTAGLGYLDANKDASADERNVIDAETTEQTAEKAHAEQAAVDGRGEKDK